MGCCWCRDKNSLSNQSAGNSVVSNCQITRVEETSGVRKEPNDTRSLLEILETAKRSADSGNMEKGICSGEVIKDTDTGIISNDRTLTRPRSQGKYTIQNLLLIFRVERNLLYSFLLLLFQRFYR